MKKPIDFPIVMICFSACFVFLACDDDSSSDNQDSGSDTDTDTDADTDIDTDTDTDTDSDAIKAVIAVPATFDGIPETLATMFFSSFPPTGMPDAFGDSFMNPQITYEEPYQMIISQSSLAGEYYMAVTLYCEGGGNGGFPVAGVDWVGAAATSMILGPGTGTIDAGTIELMPAE